MSLAVDEGREQIALAGKSGSGAAGQFALQKNFKSYFAWWFSELASITPRWLRDAFAPGAEIPSIHEIDGQPMLIQPGKAPQPLSQVGHKSLGDVPAIYLLPRASALLRDARLPAASRAHAQSIMDLQIASETPFTQEEVYADTIITGENEAARELLASQAIVPRAVIDAVAGRMRGQEIRLAAIDIADGEGAGLGFNLLPEEQRAPVKRGGATLNVILLTVLAGSAVFAGWAWRDLQTRRVATANAALSLAETQAAGAMQVHTMVTNGIVGAQQIEAVKSDPLRFAAVYEAVSATLPTGSWLDEFAYKRPEADLSGFAANSASVIEALEKSGLASSVKFVAPVVTDPRNGAERFRIKVVFADAQSGEAK